MAASAAPKFKITSKSGTNDFHGSLFFTTHQPNLNAYQRYFGFGTSSQRDNNKFNQFGGSIGGPIWKNKIFAFFNYETVRQPNSDNIGSGWYDTPALAALAPSGSIAAQYLSFPGNGVVNHGLVPNTTCASAGLTEGVNCAHRCGRPEYRHAFESCALSVGPNRTESGFPLRGHGLRLDQFPDPRHWRRWQRWPREPGYHRRHCAVHHFESDHLSLPCSTTAASTRMSPSKDRIGFAIYWVPQSTDDYNGNRTYDVFHHNQINDAFSVIWNHTFSATLLNELRANAAGWRWNELKDNPQTPIGLPKDSIGQIGSITLGNFGGNVGSELDQWTYSYKDVATKIIGRHTIKFGGDATRLFYLNACVPLRRAGLQLLQPVGFPQRCP